MEFYKNKSYKSCKIDEELFKGYIESNNEHYEMPVDLLKKLCKELGFSYELYLTLVSLSKETADKLLDSMCSRSGHREVILLLEDNSQAVIGYTLDTDRDPLLNDEFIARINRIITSSDAVELAEVQYTAMDTTASVLVKKVEPISVVEVYDGRDPITITYDIGILIQNDELTNASCRLVVFLNGEPIYLPASIYSLTTSRYKRSTSSSAEALEVVILRVIDDLREDDLVSKINDMHTRYKYNKNLVVSYEEYNSLLNTLRKIPTIIEDNSYMSPVLDIYDEFEKRYTNLLDKKSSYIWRCTALGRITLDKMLRSICTILRDMNAPAVEYFAIRDLLGYYVTTTRIVEDIAQDKDIKEV